MGFCKKYILFILILILIVLSLYSLSKNSESDPNDGVFIITMIDSDKSDQTVQNKQYFLHPGGEYLDPKLLLELVKSTIKDFDINLNHENNTVLIYETLITETLGGQYPYNYARDNYRNYGIAQFRLKTAYFLKAFIKRISKHDYNLLLSLRVSNKSEKWNLMYNVKWDYANGDGGSASSCTTIVDFIIHFTLYIKKTAAKIQPFYKNAVPSPRLK